MREKALQIAAQQDGEQDKLNYLREYLQHRILREMFELNWLTELVFPGGTALRTLHELNRFSEVLNFHLKQKTKNYSVKHKLSKLQKKLDLSGYQVEISSSSEGNFKTRPLNSREVYSKRPISRPIPIKS